MTSIIKLEALSGVLNESPLCYLLQVDEFHFLLDCGWDESFDTEYIDKLKSHIGNIDAVLLSYADPNHLGALPYLVGKCGLNCPVYATVPVYKMGQMFMYDWYQSHQNVEDFTIFSLDDVDCAFEKVQQLKYSQNVSLKGRGHGLQVTPLPAGHMIGGTIWRITKMGEEEIVYAVDFNHKKERHLNGCSFESIGRPNLMITDSYNSQYTQARRKQRDEQLLTNILQTLRNGGNVLVVIDTAGRVLELAQLLDTLWHNAEAGLISYSLVMMNNFAYNVVEFAKSQVEWMSDKIMRSFQEGRYNPFQFRHVQLCHSIAELARVRSPKVVLASCPDMESGFSRELFLEWCGNPRNSIILTQRSSPGTLARSLLDNLETGTRQVIMEIKKRIRLEGAELEEYYKQKKEKETEAARARLEQKRRTSRVTTDNEGSGESDDEDVMDLGMTVATANGNATTAAAAPNLYHSHYHDLMIRFEQQQKLSFFKQAKKVYPMYQFTEEKVKWDDYGEIIRPEDYMIIEAPLPGSDVKKEETDSGSVEICHPEVGTEFPTKCIRYLQSLEVLAKVCFIDFEGRCDGESIKKLLAMIKPKQLVLVHGTPEATKYLADYCKNTSGVVQGRVFCPALFDSLDATIESHIYQVTLTDVLMSSLEFQQVKDAELSWVDARMILRKPLTIEGGSKVTIAKKEEPKHHNPLASSTGIPTLDLIVNSNEAPTHAAVYVNDPKLSDLKMTLVQNGFHAEFAGGVLYVNSVLAIRRNEAGRFHIEGCACEDYFRIKELLYKQFAIV